jgi:Integrase core domain
VRKAVSEYLACELGRLRRPGVQARMILYHPSRRFQMVAMDVLEMSPETKRGNRKVSVIGDMFSRYVVAVPISDKSDDTVARVFIDRWVSVFGPPEQLLTDLGPNFKSGVTAEMCRLIGTKIFLRRLIIRRRTYLSKAITGHYRCSWGGIYWMKMTGISVCRWQCSGTTRRNKRPLE